MRSRKHPGPRDDFHARLDVCSLTSHDSLGTLCAQLSLRPVWEAHSFTDAIRVHHLFSVYPTAAGYLHYAEHK